MSQIFEKRAVERAIEAARDAISCIKRGNYTDAEHLLQEALADARKAAAQRKARK